MFYQFSRKKIFHAASIEVIKNVFWLCGKILVLLLHHIYDPPEH